MKPRRGEGVVLYSRTTHNAADWFVVELADGDVIYTCMTSSDQQVRSLRVPLSPSSWHDVALRRVDVSGTHFLQVGNENATMSVAAPEIPRPLPMVAPHSDAATNGAGNRKQRAASTFVGDDFIVTTTTTNELYVGGLPAALYARLPPEVRSRDGFSGCLAALNLNGDTRTLRSRGVRLPDQFYDDVIEGCEGRSKIPLKFTHTYLQFAKANWPTKNFKQIISLNN